MSRIGILDLSQEVNQQIPADPEIPWRQSYFDLIFFNITWNIWVGEAITWPPLLSPLFTHSPAQVLVWDTQPPAQVDTGIHPTSLPGNRMTDTCKSITLPLTLFGGGNRWIALPLMEVLIPGEWAVVRPRLPRWSQCFGSDILPWLCAQSPPLLARYGWSVLHHKPFRRTILIIVCRANVFFNWIYQISSISDAWYKNKITFSWLLLITFTALYQVNCKIVYFRLNFGGSKVSQKGGKRTKQEKLGLPIYIWPIFLNHQMKWNQFGPG